MIKFFEKLKMKNIEKIPNSISITWPGSKRRKCFAITVSEGKEFVVDWNDGSAPEKTTGTGKPQRMCHVYGNTRIYTIHIIGTTEDCLLTYLSCSSGQITHIDASTNLALRELWCGNNELTELDVSANTELKKLDCSENKITALDVSANTKLECLSFFNNRITDLDVSANTILWRLWCSNNRITDLDLSANTELLNLRCYGNRLSALDLKANTLLKELWCSSNQLTMLNLEANAELQNLRCFNNRLLLSDMYEASKMIEETAGKQLGTQTCIPQEIPVKSSVDYSAQMDINNTTTDFDVEKNGKPASLSDYTITDGVITFHHIGSYKVTLTNEGIDSQTKYPAQVVAEFTVIAQE